MSLVRRSLLVVFASALGVLITLTMPLAAHGGDISITMSHYAFSPATITIRAGDTVTWTNTDQAPHDVTTTSAPEGLRSPTLQRGDTWTHTFAVAGTYHYICSIHPDMHATVIVASPPVASATAVAAARAPSTAVAGRAASPKSMATTHVTAPPASGRAHAAAHQPLTAHSAGPHELVAVPTPDTVATTSPPQSATLRPLVIVAGIVAAGAVFCLLLLASRPTPADPGSSSAPGEI